MQQFLNGVNSIFDIVFLLFVDVPSIWGITVISVITGFFMILLYGKVSNQKAIKRRKDLIKGHLLEIRLYQENSGLVMNSLQKLIVENIKYILLAFKPMLILLFPVVIILVQLAERYEFKAFEASDTIVVNVVLEEMDKTGLFLDRYQEKALGHRISKTKVTEEGGEISLKVPEGLIIETPPLRVLKEKTVSWRLKVLQPGAYDIVVKVGEKEYEKKLYAQKELNPISHERRKDDVLHYFLYPAEEPLTSEDAIRSISLNYGHQDLKVFGTSIHWMFYFIILSILTGLLFKRPLRVEI